KNCVRRLMCSELYCRGNKSLISLLAGLCILTSQLHAASSHKQLEHQTIQVNTIQRSYYIHNNQQKSTQLQPAFIFLHGGSEHPKSAAKNTRLNRYADQYGFVAVYPLGINKHWNDGRGIYYDSKQDTLADDVQFLSKLIDHLIKYNQVDPAKVYLAGMSNGGIMAQRAACELSHQLAAVASISSSMASNIVNNCKPTHPISVLLINGTKDPIVPFEGGEVHFFRKSMGYVESTEKTYQFWLNQNQCPKTESKSEIPDKNRKDHSHVTFKIVKHCKENQKVGLYTIIGGGHNLPGSQSKNRPLLVGWKNEDINAIEAIWAFFNLDP
ncbi:MAG: alpha/beta hydrolase family esterase, partial [bacterium]